MKPSSADPTAAPSTRATPCAEQLARRRGELAEDLAWYAWKLGQLERLGPDDCPGLKRIYRRHLRQARALLDGLG
jgi:hypothetical protein